MHKHVEQQINVSLLSPSDQFKQINFIEQMRIGQNICTLSLKVVYLSINITFSDREKTAFHTGLEGKTLTPLEVREVLWVTIVIVVQVNHHLEIQVLRCF